MKFTRTNFGKVLQLDSDDEVVRILDPTTTQVVRHPSQEGVIVFGVSGDGNNDARTFELTASSISVPVSADFDDLMNKLANEVFYDEAVRQLEILNSVVIAPVLSTFLDTNGDGTGLIDANIDASSGPVRFYFQPPAGKLALIKAALIYIEETGSFDSGRYGRRVELINGINAGAERNGVGIDFFAGQPIKKNIDFNKHGFQVTLSEYGIGNNALVANSAGFFANFGFILLDGDANDFIEVIIEDDHSSHFQHLFKVYGSIIDKPV